jgi:hypothetical protein
LLYEEALNKEDLRDGLLKSVSRNVLFCLGRSLQSRRDWPRTERDYSGIAISAAPAELLPISQQPNNPNSRYLVEEESQKTCRR